MYIGKYFIIHYFVSDLPTFQVVLKRSEGRPVSKSDETTHSSLSVKILCYCDHNRSTVIVQDFNYKVFQKKKKREQ